MEDGLGIELDKFYATQTIVPGYPADTVTYLKPELDALTAARDSLVHNYYETQTHLTGPAKESFFSLMDKHASLVEKLDPPGRETTVKSATQATSLVPDDAWTAFASFAPVTGDVPELILTGTVTTSFTTVTATTDEHNTMTTPWNVPGGYGDSSDGDLYAPGLAKCVIGALLALVGGL